MAQNKDPAVRPEPSSSSGPKDTLDPAARTALGPNPAASASPEARTDSAFSPTVTGQPLRYSAPPALQPGQVLAGRYEIARFLARGGMGEVYEAKDLKLQGTVALKTIRPEVAQNMKVVGRFLREIHLARRVTHPNVCRIFDVDEHHFPAPEGASEPPAELTFLTMELLSGETLSRRIARGRLSTAEAFDIVSQIAAGLEAAHAVGIIHRDFKSGNVMLVPPTGSQSRTRVVITDFGLARVADGGETLASISETGDVVGTPAYMAPEQVEGKDVTAVADIYALGVVLYEMVTGTRPFTGGSAMSIAVKRLTVDPPSPRTLVTDLEPAWEAAILRCLERNPEDRFASALDLVRALSGERIAPAAGTVRRRRLAAGAVGILVLAGLAGWLARRPSSPGVGFAPSPAPSPARPAAGPRRSLAVLGLSNVSGRGDVAWVGTALAEMLASDLASGETLRIVPGQEVVRARTDLGLTGEDLRELAGDALLRVRRSLGADLFLFGSYTVLAGGEQPLLRIDLRVQDAASGQILASGSATGTEGQFFDLVSRASKPLREKLGVPSATAAESLQVEASLPSSRDAARSYAEGLARLRASDALGARGPLERAIAAEPKHPLPHAALANAWLALGHQAKAHEEAKLAAALSEGRPAGERLSIEALFHETANDWGKAIESYRSLVAAHPDDVEHLLRLAEAQTRRGRAREALVTVESLRKLPSPTPEDPRVDLAAALAAQSLGDASQQRVFAAQARQKGLARGMRYAVGRARLFEAGALQELGESQPAMDAAEDARQIAESVEDQAGSGKALELMALILERRGDLGGAIRLYGRALQTSRQIGDLRSVARTLHNTGGALLKQGQMARAQAVYAEALATFTQIGAKYEAAATLNDLGTRLQYAGDLAGAQKRYQEALALFGEVGQRSAQVITLTNIGEIEFTRGNLRQAQDLYQESLAQCREIGDKGWAGYNLFRLGELLAARGDLGLAREKYDEALAVLKEVGDRINAGQARLGIAALEVFGGRAVEGEAFARESEEVFRAEGAADLEALARIAVAEALLGQKKAAAAREVGSAVAALAQKSEDLRVRLLAATLAARLGAAGGGKAEAAEVVRALGANAARAGRAGFLIVALEARLAAAEIDGWGTAAGRAKVDALIREAKAKDLGWIALRAAALLPAR